jgi:hypothetical protein
MALSCPDAPPLVLWAEIAGMFLGQLEFLTVFSSLVKLLRGGSTQTGIKLL